MKVELRIKRVGTTVACANFTPKPEHLPVEIKKQGRNFIKVGEVFEVPSKEVAKEYHEFAGDRLEVVL